VIRCEKCEGTPKLATTPQISHVSFLAKTDFSMNVRWIEIGLFERTENERESFLIRFRGRQSKIRCEVGFDPRDFPRDALYEGKNPISTAFSSATDISLRTSDSIVTTADSEFAQKYWLSIARSGVSLLSHNNDLLMGLPRCFTLGSSTSWQENITRRAAKRKS
jgi:hypothetical protein